MKSNLIIVFTFLHCALCGTICEVCQCSGSTFICKHNTVINVVDMSSDGRLLTGYLHGDTCQHKMAINKVTPYAMLHCDVTATQISTPVVNDNVITA